MLHSTPRFHPRPSLYRRIKTKGFLELKCVSISNSGQPYLRHRSTPGEYEPTNLTLKHSCSDHYPLDLYRASISFGKKGRKRRTERETAEDEATDLLDKDKGEDRIELSIILPESEETVANIFSMLGKPDEDPHWADVWHGGIALNEYLVSSSAGGSLVRGKRVLELGCGVGLTGVLCAMEGAKKVTMTDREPFACYCAIASAIANGFASVARALDEDARVVDGLTQMDASLLDDIVYSNRSSECNCVEARIMNWFKLDEYLKEEDDFAYDVVIACDCLYCEEAVEAVASIVFEAFSRRQRQEGKGVNNTYLSSPFTFLLADPPSRFPQNHEKFLNIMQEKIGVSDVEKEDTLLAVRNPFQRDEGEMVVKICKYTFL